jgi:hypothetical protein
MSRVQRVYQLSVIYPEGSFSPGWWPACWSSPDFLKTLSRAERRELRRRQFRWPRERAFLSSSGAYGRASLLRWYGAEVAVQPSNPVTWPDYEADAWESLWDSPAYGDAMQWSPELEYAAEAQRRAFACQLASGEVSIGELTELLGELEARGIARAAVLEGVPAL